VNLALVLVLIAARCSDVCAKSCMLCSVMCLWPACLSWMFVLRCHGCYSGPSTVVLECVITMISSNTCCQADEHVVSKGLEDNAQERTALRNKPGSVRKTVFST